MAIDLSKKISYVDIIDWRCHWLGMKLEGFLETQAINAEKQYPRSGIEDLEKAVDQAVSLYIKVRGELTRILEEVAIMTQTDSSEYDVRKCLTLETLRDTNSRYLNLLTALENTQAWITDSIDKISEMEKARIIKEFEKLT